MTTRKFSADLADHPLLDEEQVRMARAFARVAVRKQESFDLLQFAEIALRATARDAGPVLEGENIVLRVKVDRELKRTAVLYVYEALKACDIAIIKEWPEFDEMLKNLVYLAGQLP
jgi:hypothetical protein